MIPLAENDSESDAEYDSENEDGAEAAKKKMKMNPDFAEADHCHAPVTRYARHLIRVLNRGWLPARLYKGKVFKALAHFLFSFTPPKDANASCVRGLAETPSRPVGQSSGSTTYATRRPQLMEIRRTRPK
jgi:hypothetical protein